MTKAPKLNTDEKVQRRKIKVSKRIGLVAALAMILVLSFASLAFAAQNVEFNGSGNNQADFASTPKVFNPDGTSNYPNEIYLPNESDPAQYRIHSNYTATTDACASCHATHTAVGESLLQWGTVYDTCMACHDGSVTTTYDVKAGVIGTSAMSAFGGAFGTLEDQKNNSGSNHNVTGSMDIYAAPGGPGTANIEVAANNPTVHGQVETDKNVSWDVEFGCQSCHSPHGQGGNARILNPDVNGFAWSQYNKGVWTSTNHGTQKVPVQMAGNVGVTDYNVDGVNDTWILGYPYSYNIYVNGTAVTTGFKISNADGTTKITFDTAPTGAVTATFQPSLVVKMNVQNYLKADESVQHVSGLNAFCGACHTDYNTQAAAASGSGATLTGQYTEAYRHQVGMNWYSPFPTGTNMKLENGKVTCETCHVAHGTNETYWGKTLATTYQAKEIAGSSALKRLPNMGTCETCHQKGVGNAGYAANNGATVVAPVANTASGSPGGGYVGQEACKKCHGNLKEHFAETWHPSMSRPGVTKATWDSVSSALVNPDGSFNSANAAALDAKAAPGFAQALYTTMTELVGKNMIDSKGAVITDPALWKAKGVNAAKILVWTTGTVKQEIAVKGSVLNKAAPDTDKWFIITNWGRGTNDFVPALEEDYTCGATALGCHTTGKTTNNGSADFTAWLNAAAQGQEIFQLGVTCESCHGQGANHVGSPSAKNIVNPATFTPVEQTVGLGATQNVDGTWSATGASKFLNAGSNALACGKCHTGGRHQGDYYSAGTYSESPTFKTFTPSTHFTSGLVGCNNCHNTHQESKGLIAYTSSQQTCESCHGKIANFNLSTYMPALERDADLHEHQFKTGAPIPPATSGQSDAGLRRP